MNIITCVKQVPASSQVDVDPDTGVLIRDGNNVKMNPYDLYALELSFQLRDKRAGSTVHTVTMGPPSARQVLLESFFMGGDEATLVSDPRFAGADVLATAYTLSQLIRTIGNFDVVVCGKQTTDGDTAQVGPEIAEFLGIPHVPYVIDILNVTDRGMRVRSIYDAHDEIVDVAFPCLITVEKGHLVPRLPSYRRKLAYRDHPIGLVALSDLVDPNPDHYGLKGSPTQVEAIFPPDKRTESVRHTGTKTELAQTLFDLLKESKYV